MVESDIVLPQLSSGINMAPQEPTPSSKSPPIHPTAGASVRDLDLPPVSVDPQRMASTAAASLPAPPREGPGATIGRYKLLQEIGEGGFGTVFMAEQEHPVRRKVALQ